jgi:WXXGXW repeat (2 copies)
MRTSKFVAAAFAALVGITALGGCVVRGSGVVRVRTAPPPPRSVYVETRPGYIWVDGYWNWNGYDYVWVDGYYERDRPNHVYVRGYWTNDRGYHSYHRGRWTKRSNNNVIIYKDRGRSNHNHNNRKPTVVYDHSR